MHEQYLYQCLTGRRKAPADRCPELERATAGRVTCEQLRPDMRWTRVPDSSWPHPAGRPCIDPAGPGGAYSNTASGEPADQQENFHGE
jgi:hypothetical protein